MYDQDAAKVGFAGQFFEVQFKFKVTEVIVIHYGLGFLHLSCAVEDRLIFSVGLGWFVVHSASTCIYGRSVAADRKLTHLRGMC
jgi:hypothetical protein